MHTNLFILLILARVNNKKPQNHTDSEEKHLFFILFFIKQSYFSFYLKQIK